MPFRLINCDRNFFKTKDNKEAALIRYIKGKSCIFCWINESDSYENRMRLSFVNICDVDGGKEELIRLEIWDLLSENVKERIDIKEDKKEETNTIDLKIVKTKKKKYLDVPEKITCSKCGKIQKFSQSILGRKLETKNIKVEDFVSNFQCQKCNPTKGRKINPDYIGIPKKISCSKCKRIINVSQPKVIDECKSKKIETQKYINDFVCGKCKKNDK